MQYYDLPFCELSIYDDYAVTAFKEGIHVEVRHIKLLEEIIHDHIINKPFVYISHRKNSYSFDPFSYDVVDKIKNIATIIIVKNNQKSNRHIQFERQFSKKNIIAVNTLSEAVLWVKTNFRS